jgi:hypothetical protein
MPVIIREAARACVTTAFDLYVERYQRCHCGFDTLDLDLDIVVNSEYLLLLSPIIYGLVLYVYGMALHEYFYFPEASIAMIFAWGIYDLLRRD